MPREILIYSDIHDSTAKAFIQELNDAGSNEVDIRLNTDGGDPQSSFGMIAKMQESKAKKNVKIDGKAHSTGLFIVAFADGHVQALNVSQGLLHRAAYPRWLEESTHFSASMKDELININSNVKEALEGRIDTSKLKALKGVTLDEVFSMDNRTEVMLNAQEMKEIGFVDEIVELTPKIAASMHSSWNEDKKIEIPKAEKINKSKIEVMTKSEFKANHLADYNAILEEGRTAGATAEKNRVAAWMVYNTINAKAVTEGIASGNDVTMKDMGEFTLQAAANGNLKAAAAESAEGGEFEEQEAEGNETDASKKKVELSAFMKEAKDLRTAKMN